MLIEHWLAIALEWLDMQEVIGRSVRRSVAAPAAWLVYEPRYAAA